MTDTALLQLLELCRSEDQNTLLILDENATELPAKISPNIRILTNRYDINETAQKQQWPSVFSDFVFDQTLYHDIQRVVYRISKEKRVVEHIVQSAWRLLPVGGELVIAGYKNEGIKTFAKRMSEAFHCNADLQRGQSQLHIYRLTKASSVFDKLNADDYHELRQIGTLNECHIYSKPGVFAWDRFDEGSSFLLQHLPTFLSLSDHTRQQALDLGCGYGLLAMALLQAGCGHVTATDNNAAAILACESNIEKSGFLSRASVLPGNCGDNLQQQFDLVVCNPPFHQGFDVELDLTTVFLQATRKLLRKRGRALFVVNSFITVERKAKPFFGNVETIADNRRFKLVQLMA